MNPQEWASALAEAIAADNEGIGQVALADRVSDAMADDGFPMDSHAELMATCEAAAARVIADANDYRQSFRHALGLAASDYRETVQRSEELRAVRNELISRALTEGMTHAQIAEATGLTRGRIGQLAGQ